MWQGGRRLIGMPMEGPGWERCTELERSTDREEAGCWTDSGHSIKYKAELTE